MALYLGSKMVSALSGAAGGSSANPVLEELTATENKEYTPGEGVDGFSKVVVNVESPIDIESLIAVCDAINGEAVDGESVEAKVMRLMQTKEDIKAALIEKGQTVTDADAFSSYADKIRAIKGNLVALTATENGTYTPGEGIDGYDSVTVEVEGGGGYSGTCGANLSWDLDPTGKLTILGEGAMYDYNYNENNQPWDYCKDSIKSVVVSNGVTRIGNGAFYRYPNLETIAIPASISSIGKYAFDNCPKMIGVYISNLYNWCGITFDSYNANPLYSAHNLYLNNELVVELTLPNKVSISAYAFHGCESITSVSIPSGVYSLGASVFSGCKNLNSVTLSPTLSELPAGTFSQCASLTSIVIPDSVTKIGMQPFGQSGLTSVVIGSGVTEIYAGHSFGTKLTSATFKVTTGWKCKKSSTEVSVSADDLADPSKAASLLRNDYNNHTWTRT